MTEGTSKKDPALIFVHIPKAAGTTLNHIIEAHYTPENSFATSMTRLHPNGSLEAFEALSDAERARIRLLNGHMGFGLHEQLPLRARLRKLKNYSIRQRLRAFERGNR